MRYLMFLICLSPLLLHAQDDPVDFTGFNEIQFGLSSVPLLFTAFEGRTRSGLNTEHFYHLSYRRYFQNGMLRSGINFKLIPRDEGRYWVRGLNTGYEFYLTNIVLPVNVTAGADLILYHNIVTLDTNLAEYITNVGLAPQVSFNINPFEWLTLTAEFSIAGGMEIFRIQEEESQQGNIQGPVVYSFFTPHRLMGISAGIRFRGAKPPADVMNDLQN